MVASFGGVAATVAATAPIHDTPAPSAPSAPSAPPVPTTAPLASHLVSLPSWHSFIFFFLDRKSLIESLGSVSGTGLPSDSVLLASIALMSTLHLLAGAAPTESHSSRGSARTHALHTVCDPCHPELRLRLSQVKFLDKRNHHSHGC
jgi:hypothetical protein